METFIKTSGGLFNPNEILCVTKSSMTVCSDTYAFVLFKNGEKVGINEKCYTELSNLLKEKD